MDLKILTRDRLENKVCILVGTRPSIVKQAPVIREIIKRQIPFMILHTGQHYSFELDRAFFMDLELPEPDFRLNGIKECKLHGEQTAEMLRQIEQILIEEKPKTMLVGGDANSNLSGALAARKLNLNLAHDEAGVRAHKWNVPEEHNRVIMDHISDYLFVPQEKAKQQLIKESVRGRIFVTGSTTIDAVTENLVIARQKSSILEKLSVEPRQYFVVTVHHEENVDYREELNNIVFGLQQIGNNIGMPIIFPVHPRTRHRLKHFGLEDKITQNDLVKPIKPLGYLDFLVLAANASMIISDSGGLIQESAIHRVPCITIGKYTEWMECVDLGANKISMNDPELMSMQADEFMHSDRDWENPFGKPGAAKRIVDILENSFTDPPLE